jgi:outer membrane protease
MQTSHFNTQVTVWLKLDLAAQEILLAFERQRVFHSIALHTRGFQFSAIGGAYTMLQVTE